MTNQTTDRRNEKLSANSKFAITTPEGKRFHVSTNEGLNAMLESGFVPQDSLIQIASSTNNSNVTK